VNRRHLLRAFAAILAGCARRAPALAPPPETPLRLDPLADLAPSAGLEWIVLIEPGALGDAWPVLYALVPEERFSAFAARHGGVDPRKADEILVASYPKTTLVLARTLLDPEKVERAFVEHAIRIEGRAVDHQAGPETTIVRTWGEVGSRREQLALFGRRACGLEIGAFGPLRAAILFAQNKIRKASPVFRAPPLDHAAAALGHAPARLFFPGPFEGDLALGMGGLLHITTAVGVAADPAPGRVRVRIALFGIEEKDMGAASQRLLATFDTLAQSGLGRLCGLDRPKKGPTTGHSDDTLILEVELDPLLLGKGLNDATQATVTQLLNL
jgi:hypothetical protein